MGSIIQSVGTRRWTSQAPSNSRQKQCKRCRAPPLFLDGSKSTLYHAKGCKICNDTGYRGRLGVIETLLLDDDIRGMIPRRTESAEIQRASGMRTMFEDGVTKALAGDTSIEEVLRVTRDV